MKQPTLQDKGLENTSTQMVIQRKDANTYKYKPYIPNMPSQ